MVIYSTVQSRCYIININNTGIGVHRNFSIDRQCRHFACPFQLADNPMQMGVHISLYPFYTTKKMTRVTATVPKMRFVGSKVSSHIVQKHVTYCNQQSLSRCITCHRCLQQSHAAKHVLLQLEVKLCCHVTVTK